MGSNTDMKNWILKHKTDIKNAVYTIIVLLGFMIMGYSRGTSVIVAILFLMCVEFLIPIQEVLEEIRDSGRSETK